MIQIKDLQKVIDDETVVLNLAIAVFSIAVLCSIVNLWIRQMDR